MNRPTDRRTILMTAGIAAVAAVASPAAAQTADIRGTVALADGTAIPEGKLEIYLDDPAVEDKALRDAATTHVDSDGGAKTIEFSLPPAAGATASPTQRIVARLERADGWLVARGSAQLADGSPVHVTLNVVMY